MTDRRTASNLGVHLFGLASFALGAIQLVAGDFATIWHPVRPGVPFRTALVYVVAMCMIAGGLAAQWRRSTRLGLAVLAALYALAACLWLPRVIGFPRIFGTWGGFNEQFLQVVAAVIAFVSLGPASMPDETVPDESAPRARGLPVGRALFGVCLVVLGLVHFSALPQTAAMVPAWVPPGQRFWAAATGLAMLLAGVAIALRVLPVLAARLFTALIVSFALFVWLPKILAEPRGPVAWAGTMITLAIAGAGWMVADALAGYHRSLR